ncbi:MAG TPA: hypothetical protein PKE16_12805 [Hyphomicrobium sp.]|nr:hypothetical protein [Hyphomicrobium sp.]
MRTATTSTAIHTIEEPVRRSQQSVVVRFAGVAIASLLPAFFWSVIIWLGALWLGKPLSSSTVMIVGGAIALFLFAVCAPLMLRKPSTEADAVARTEIEARAQSNSNR